MKTFLLGLTLVISTFLGGCDGGRGKDGKATLDIGTRQRESVNDAPMGAASSEASNENVSKMAVPAPTTTEGDEIRPAQPLPTATTPNTSLLIKTGNMEIQVSNFSVARQQAITLVGSYGGYMNGESESYSGDRHQSYLTLRVPSKSFDAMVDKISSIPGQIKSRNISTEDVGQEYYDIQARLKTRLQVQARYRELLNKANKVEDILRTEEALRVITEEIEAAQGRLQYLSNQVNYSTLTLTLFEIVPFKPDNVAPERSFLNRVGEALRQGGKGFASLVIGLVYLWPLWIILVIFLLIYRNRIRRKTSPKL